MSFISFNKKVIILIKWTHLLTQFHNFFYFISKAQLSFKFYIIFNALRGFSLYKQQAMFLNFITIALMLFSFNKTKILKLSNFFIRFVLILFVIKSKSIRKYFIKFYRIYVNNCIVVGSLLLLVALTLLQFIS